MGGRVGGRVGVCRFLGWYRTYFKVHTPYASRTTVKPGQMVSSFELDLDLNDPVIKWRLCDVGQDEVPEDEDQVGEDDGNEGVDSNAAIASSVFKDLADFKMIQKACSSATPSDR